MIHPNPVVMQRAIDLAIENLNDGGHAVASVIVKGDEIIAEGFTTIIRDNDPTAHAEINVIRLASKLLDNRYLEGCYLYTTFEPCPMCTSAAVWAKMKGIVYGASRNDENENAHQRIKISAREVIDKGVPKLDLYEEFMRKECRKLLLLAR
ncbi:nucleoside deaminase [Candidatus Saccharibacteria bacterium]|nr:nucleoside deaminase [Candidatus Saccharibacteria bacterium]